MLFRVHHSGFTHRSIGGEYEIKQKEPLVVPYSQSLFCKHFYIFCLTGFPVQYSFYIVSYSLMKQLPSIIQMSLIEICKSPMIYRM